MRSLALGSAITKYGLDFGKFLFAICDCAFYLFLRGNVRLDPVEQFQSIFRFMHFEPDLLRTRPLRMSWPRVYFGINAKVGVNQTTEAVHFW